MCEAPPSESPGEERPEAARPCRGRLACPRAGAVLEGKRPFEGARKAKVALAAGVLREERRAPGDEVVGAQWLPECLSERRWSRGAEAPGLL